MRRVMAKPTPRNSFSVVNWYPRRDISIWAQQRCEQIICTHKLLQCFRQLMGKLKSLTADKLTIQQQQIHKLTFKSSVVFLKIYGRFCCMNLLWCLVLSDRSEPAWLVNKVWKSILSPAVAPGGPARSVTNVVSIVRPRWCVLVSAPGGLVPRWATDTLRWLHYPGGGTWCKPAITKAHFLNLDQQKSSLDWELTTMDHF